MMALVNSKDKIMNMEIATTIGLEIHFIKKWLEKDKEHPDSIIQKKLEAKDDKRKSRDNSFIMRVKAVVLDNSRRSIASIAKEFRGNLNTMTRYIQKDLCCRAYRLQTG
ncbi:unnamed protein product [Lepeophtheirus salmonis]|uniref:(salmon louse) hypothetical protein n=1 Tax=Lepeophtheirus salmonis TaxID=72036 RepID=A0A7R8CPT5_LEPSM|nr:unnamed protein product [Lepeophtheirus salmonis]CAF2842487.1 unnamed protein product [Lepeophtheirus salmonis]